MNNKPILFVRTINSNNCGIEKQFVFDSRREYKSRIMHRLDDVKAFLSINKKVYVRILFNNLFYLGEVMVIDKDLLFLKINNEMFTFKFSTIQNIFITHII